MPALKELFEGYRRFRHGTWTGDRARYVDAGVIKTGNGEMSERLEVIFDAIRALIVQHTPD
ncbi:MAG: crossover junction endodeoxyribonuclease RuvC, partial [Pseudomonadota bacterium]